MGLEIRPATRDDVPAIVAMLADDPLGAAREDLGDPRTYDAAYDRVVADPGQHLVVAEREGTVVGTLQLSVIPGLSRRGTRLAPDPLSSAAFGTVRRRPSQDMKEPAQRGWAGSFLGEVAGARPGSGSRPPPPLYRRS